jgi:hypothetical protein
LVLPMPSVVVTEQRSTLAAEQRQAGASRELNHLVGGWVVLGDEGPVVRAREVHAYVTGLFVDNSFWDGGAAYVDRGIISQDPGRIGERKVVIGIQKQRKRSHFGSRRVTTCWPCWTRSSGTRNRTTQTVYLGGPSGYGGRVDAGWVRKILRFWQKHTLNCDFSVLP